MKLDTLIEGYQKSMNAITVAPSQVIRVLFPLLIFVIIGLSIAYL